MKKTVGLALSGGGVKGAVHTGMLHLFDEIGFKPDIISGTSAGAIVGALYASGKTGLEIFEFFKTERPFSRKLWSGSGGLIHTPELRKVFEKHISEDSFEALKIPLITTATNMLTGEGHTFESGELFNRVLASAAFPGIFKPMELNGELFSDGGILNNFPVNEVREKVDFVIGMYLSPNKPLNKSELSNTTKILSRTVDIQGSQSQENKLNLCDIGICPKELVNYGTFDFKQEKLQELFDLGYSYMENHKEVLFKLKKQYP